MSSPTEPGIGARSRTVELRQPVPVGRAPMQNQVLGWQLTSPLHRQEVHATMRA